MVFLYVFVWCFWEPGAGVNLELMVVLWVVGDRMVAVFTRLSWLNFYLRFNSDFSLFFFDIQIFFYSLNLNNQIGDYDMTYLLSFVIRVNYIRVRKKYSWWLNRFLSVLVTSGFM